MTRPLLVIICLALTAACQNQIEAKGVRTPTPAATSATSTTQAPTPTEQVVRFTISGKDVSGPEGRVKVRRGAKVRLVVTSDKADEVHLHGYDIAKDVAAGGTVEIAFTASITGVFEVELEDAKLLITKLQVQ